MAREIPPDIQRVFFLDNSIFRVMCSTPGGEAIKAFNRGLDANPKLKNAHLTAMKLTPFAVLEAIGIVVPNPPPPKIPKELFDFTGARDVIDFIRDHAKAFYTNRPEVSRANILRKLAEQRSYCQQEALPLFEMCVEHPTQSATFENEIHAFLTFDYVFRFNQYGKLTPKVHAELIPFFFTEDLGMNLSKFRIAKALWDAIYTEMKLSGIPDPGMLEFTHKAMSIKSQRDTVDCELVHYACCGYSDEGKRYPVICFTRDSPDSIVPRVSVYKGVIDTMIELVEPASRKEIVGSLLDAPGAVVFCDAQGNFVHIAETDNIKPVR